MGINQGLKESKSSVSDVGYETYPNSGNSRLYYPDDDDTSDTSNEDFYIIGIGSDRLANAYHDPVEAELVECEVPVYLQNKYQHEQDEYIWNKTLTEGVFSNQVTKISEEESDDLNLKAKWTQCLYRGTNYEWKADDGIEQSNCKLEQNSVIFKWKS